ncbi:tRNA uridine(34) 5-carboxymethylaminomethyl synthesis GTPase MnmE [Ammoniphilus oxalaticus]|uniref:tRNA modification GTPase MnmE n=1 Tax=Ammoniphilus oxalaticus TaxID=66863 RepID=A0A419SGG3_9BACL|nr:tRNA uridine-5-carboxymethylaminomethyl(34) synthesis GTPase MnmE [Ammoniphilus oxalaticus]RKD22876.1 tRNA uridine(34) 5-carboxymethylaminomethyl synthesis GTPase MnmE [Ammoniphilus oxalaticus]
MEFGTIAAIATPMGEGGIGIVRVSGSESIPIVDKIFKGSSQLSTVDSHTIHYGHLIEPGTEEIQDEVMVSVMKGPRTFTREDVVEINCHGGIVSVNRTLQMVLEQGAQLAEPGEFTKRAFLNGRIDLSQAEAVIDLIRAKTDRAMSIALQQSEGKLSRLVQRLRQEILTLLAHVEVNIDYPEHDVESVTRAMLLEESEQIQKALETLLQTSRQGKILREGLSTVIIGRPNVGKSSLLNSLIQENKAIVTDIPGTTRDVIEEYVNIRGVPLKLVDTAGIRDTEDIVERIGVEKSRQLLREADLILLVLNYNEPLTSEDLALFEVAQGLNTIVIVNKIDLPQRLDLAKVEKQMLSAPLITLSVLEEQGIDQLEEAIAALFFKGQIMQEDQTYISNARHIALVKEAIQLIDEFRNSIEMGMPVDISAFDLKRTWEILGEIIGDTASDSLLDQIFSQFCLGK